MDVYELDEHLRQMTPHQMKIVQAMYDVGSKWYTRSQVAKQLGKRRLTPYDIDCLTMLAEKQILELSTKPTTAPGSDFAYIYMMPDSVADLVAHWSEIRNQIRGDTPSPAPRKPINLLPDDE